MKVAKTLLLIAVLVTGSICLAPNAVSQTVNDVGYPDPFTARIGSRAIDSIKVIPDGDTTLRAGDSIVFRAEAYDNIGNLVEGIIFDWSLDFCSECIGSFVDSVLYVTRVGTGQAVATAEGITARSGVITVLPGELSRMVFDIDPTQVVGQNLLTSAAIILYDEFNNLKTDYSLTQQPISLVPGIGALVPDALTNNSLQIGGVVRLLPAEISYFGPTATTTVYASAGSVVSNEAAISFNGYDGLDALDFQDETISQVFAGHQTSVRVPIVNNGNITAETPVIIRAFFTSGTPAEEISFTPSPAGVTDTIAVPLPLLNDYPAVDTLFVELEAVYTVEGQPYTTVDSQYYPVDVASPGIFELVVGSYTPETILPDLAFNISFDVSADGFQQTIDSGHVEIQLVADEAGPALATLFSGPLTDNTIEGGLIRYRNLPGYLDPALGLAPGDYIARVNYHAVVQGNVFSLVDLHPAVVTVLAPINLSYVSGTFAPTSVSAGVEDMFTFEVHLANNYPVQFIAEGSSFSVTGDDFSLTTNLMLESGELPPGNTLIESEALFIPDDQLGVSLVVSAGFSYQVAGIQDTFRFSTDFDQLAVEVLELPTAQILQADLVAPNAPTVNTGQAVQVSCRLTNQSSTPIDSLLLRLFSDGEALFDSDLMVRDIPAYETVEVLFDVTAGAVANPSEVMRVDIVSGEINVLPPLDNIALMATEEPALLDLTYETLGIEQGFIDVESDFIIRISLVNLGQAAISEGTVRLIVEGLDEDGPDTLFGLFDNDNINDEFIFRAPLFDTTLTFTAELIAIPLDLNSGLPAQLVQTSFEFIARVVALAADLFVQTEPIGSNLVLPGRKKELFELELTNTGISTVSSLQLDEIELFVVDGEGNPVNARTALNIGKTGFYESGIRITTATSAESRIILTFDEYIIAPAETRLMTFATEFKDIDLGAVAIQLSKEGIMAFFIAGPNAGFSATVSSDTEEETLVDDILAVKEASLEGSFIAETNPFNPNDPAVSPLRFSYELDEDTNVEFRILTLIGEQVYSRDFASGSEGGRAGENIVEWYGRNDGGHLVMNGVYVASMLKVATGEQAFIKIAVIK